MWWTEILGRVCINQQVLEQMRASEKTSLIPVLILTAKELTAEDFEKLSANNIQQLIFSAMEMTYKILVQ